MTEIQTEIDLAPKRKYKWSAHEKVRLKAMTDDGFPAMLIGKALGRSYKSVKLMQDAQSIHFKWNTNHEKVITMIKGYTVIPTNLPMVICGCSHLD